MDVKQEPCDLYNDIGKIVPLFVYAQTEENDSRKSLKLKNNDERDMVGEIISAFKSEVTGQLENVEFKQENIESEISKIECQSLDLPIKIDYDSVRENVQSFSTTIKQELVDTAEVKATDYSDIKQDISNIKQDISEYDQFKNVCELLTSHCDLPTLKNENTDYPKNTKKWCVFQKDYPSLQLRPDSSNGYFKKHPVICKFCGKTFVKEFEFLQHYFIHSVNNKKKKLSKRIEGNIRKQTDYLNMFKLKQHLTIHSNEKPFKCNICLKEYKYKFDLHRHLKMHSNEKPFMCNICSKKYKHKSNLQDHLKIHSNEKPFKCDICLNAFNKKYHLQRHLKIHSNEKPFKCEICLKELRRKSDFQDHLKIHSNEKQFKCDICLKGYNTKSHLRYHLKIHSNEKQFKCNICSKGFNQKSRLQRHLIIHSNEKPFKCNICWKKFNQKSYLQSHLKRHANEKHFKSYDYSHLKIHSNETPLVESKTIQL